MTWADAVVDVPEKDVVEAMIPPNGGRVHVQTGVDDPQDAIYIITNHGPDALPVAIWVSPRQPHVQVWDPQGKHNESIQVQFTTDDLTARRGHLAVDRQIRPA